MCLPKYPCLLHAACFLHVWSVQAAISLSAMRRKSFLLAWLLISRRWTSRVPSHIDCFVPVWAVKIWGHLDNRTGLSPVACNSPHGLLLCRLRSWEGAEKLRPSWAVVVAGATSPRHGYQQWYLKMSFLPLSALHIDCWGLVVNIIEGTVMSFCAWYKAGPSADVALVCDSPMLLSVPVHPIWTILAIRFPNTVSLLWVVCLSGPARRPIRRCALQNAAVLFKKGKRRKTDVPSPL